MAEQISLESLNTYLFQSTKAIKKRALAIIFNEDMIEAEALLKQFIGVEPDSELQVIAHKVLQKLTDFQAFSDTMTQEMIVPLLKSPDSGTRIRAFRRLLRKKSPTLALQIQQCCPNEKVPEVGLLMMTILNANPHPGNLPLIIGFLESPSARLRMEAFKGLNIMINGSLLPLFFKGLLDHSQEIQLMTMQMVKSFQRKHLLDALEQMLESTPEVSQLASKVLSQFQGSDIIPLLKRYLNHPDRTTGLFIQTIYAYLGTHGEAGADRPPLEMPVIEEAPGPALDQAEAAPPPSEPPPPPKPKGPTEEELRAERMLKVFQDLAEALRQSWEAVPAFFVEPVTCASPPRHPHEIIEMIRNVFDRLRYTLTTAAICLYFKKGNRSQAADRICFRAIQQGILEVNSLQLLQTLAPSFPEPSGAGDLFPLVISKVFRQEQDEEFFDPFLSLQEGLNLIEEYPEEAEKFIAPAIDSLSVMVKNFSGFLSANRLLVKQVLPDGTRVYDVWAPTTAQIDPKSVSTISLSHNFVVLVSRDSLNFISFEPFLRFDGDQKKVVFGPLPEHDLWEFLKKYEVNEAYRAYLTDSGDE